MSRSRARRLLLREIARAEVAGRRWSPAPCAGCGYLIHDALATCRHGFYHRHACWNDHRQVVHGERLVLGLFDTVRFTR